MKVPQSVKPLVWGAIGGAIVAMIIGFVWGGWVTGGTAQDMEEASAQAAVVNALTPVCVAKAEQQPDQLLRLQDERDWKRDGFVIEAGWVDNVREEYRQPVAEACATVAVEGMTTAESSD
jgi:hypothetical protein